ncbi:MAG: DUF5107 domain-containing protein [Chloroflexota bacterium]|nr:DUF5107 domain-containing protein [Chloroflexota bacterium]
MRARKWRRITRIITLLVVLAAGAGAGPPAGRTQAGGRLYRETGHTLAAPFVAYFDSHGGLPIFGLPLAEAEDEGGRLVQYLERARLELHPENAGTPYEVQLGLLGVTLTAGRRFAPAAPGDTTATPSRRFFAQTGHTLRGDFLAYWQAHGGLAQFGYPLSEEVSEGGYTVQYFERNRFEAHPENRPPYNVLLGLLGRDLLARRVGIAEAQVTLPTYGYEAAFQPAAPDRPAAYPGLNPTAVGPPQPRTYRLIQLENRYLRLAIMPELGGRVYSVVYKPTGHEELYRNPVVKPAPFGARGWWLGVGGHEWAFPTEEHGLVEYLPWTATTARDGDGGVTVTLTVTDRQTGLFGTARVTLRPDEATYGLDLTVSNPTGSPQPFQMWTNAMLAPGGSNRARDVTWTLPTSALTVHSTDDASFGPPHGRIGWPQQGGRDLADSRTWTGYLGGFVPPDTRTGDYAAVYNPLADEGMVRVGPPATQAAGLKIFGFGPHFDPHIYTDDDSSYAELWGGLLPTFWDNTSLAPGAAAGWQESWQPVTGLGRVVYATAWGSVGRSADGLTLAPARPALGTVVLRQGSSELARRPFEARPDAPLLLPAPAGLLTLEVLDGAGARVLSAEVP